MSRITLQPIRVAPPGAGCTTCHNLLGQFISYGEHELRENVVELLCLKCALVIARGNAYRAEFREAV